MLSMLYVQTFTPQRGTKVTKITGPQCSGMVLNSNFATVFGVAGSRDLQVVHGLKLEKTGCHMAVLFLCQC